MFQRGPKAPGDLLSQAESGMPSGFRDEVRRTQEQPSRRSSRSRHVTVPGVESLEGRQMLAAPSYTFTEPSLELQPPYDGKLYIDPGQVTLNDSMQTLGFARGPIDPNLHTISDYLVA